MPETIYLPTEQEGTILRTLSDDEFVTLFEALAPEDISEDRQTVLDERDAILREAPGAVMLAILHEGELVGSTDLAPDPDRPYIATVGCGVIGEHRRNHYGTAAVRAMVRYGFEQRGFSVITARIARDNTASQDGAWQAGFFCYAGPVDGNLIFAFDRSRL